jgi:hypothetical protein
LCNWNCRHFMHEYSVSHPTWNKMDSSGTWELPLASTVLSRHWDWLEHLLFCGYNPTTLKNIFCFENKVNQHIFHPVASLKKKRLFYVYAQSNFMWSAYGYCNLFWDKVQCCVCFIDQVSAVIKSTRLKFWFLLYWTFRMPQACSQATSRPYVSSWIKVLCNIGI